MNDSKVNHKPKTTPIKLPTNDEPWGAQKIKVTILLSDKIDRYMQQKGSNDL